MRGRHLGVRSRLFFVGVLAFAIAAGAASWAFAAASASHPDYQGTYAGIATTNSGKKVPFTLFLRQRGTQMQITIRAEGHTVSVTAPEQWPLPNTVQVDVTLPRILRAIATGSGTATFANNGKLWEAIGEGTGTVLITHSGHITGEAQMVTRGFDQTKADAWFAANADKLKPNATTGASSNPIKAPAVEKAVRILAPTAAQPPVPDAQKLATLALIGLFIAVIILSSVIFGWNQPPTQELKNQITKSVDAVVGYSPSEGGAS